MAKILSTPTTLQLQSPRPAWAAAVTAGGPWTELTDAPVFSTWMEANLVPAGGYRGAGPIEAIRDAYSYPAWDAIGQAAYLFGGGHGDGSCNAVVKFDITTLRYSIVVPPTPPSAYPPSFTAPNAPIQYPSGASNGFFQSAATLSDARDLAYAAPVAARASSHTYGALTAFNGKVQTHYGATCDADVRTGLWTHLAGNDYGPQIPSAVGGGNGVYYGTEPLQNNTVAAVDTATGAAWLTLIQGDAGSNWRSGVLRVDLATHTVTHYVGLGFDAPSVKVGNPASMTINGRDLWIHMPTYDNNTNTAGVLWRLNMDTRALTHHRLQGSLPAWPAFSGYQENLPFFHDGTALQLWNHGPDRDALYAVNLTPASGAGSRGDPYNHIVTRVARGTSSMPDTRFVYRLDYIPEWGLVMVLPRASSRWYALSA